MLIIKKMNRLIKPIMCLMILGTILNSSRALDTINQVELFFVEPLFDDIDTSSQSPPLESIQEFVNVYEKIRKHYITKHSDKDLFKIAMEGMLLHLDPYSAYLDKEDTKLLYDSSLGLTTSIGINVIPSKDYVEVVAPFDGSPAAKVGVKAGDLIIKINNINTKGLTTKNVYALLNGKKGSKVDLTIIRNDKRYNFSMKRSNINAQSVESKVINNIGYIRIRNFQSTTPSSLLKQLKSLQKQNVKGLILDLRNNPGGVLKSGIATADIFLQDGVVVGVTGRNSESSITYHADKSDASDGLPIIVLINFGTASAAEVVAAALQENNRAKLLGNTSFGKGLIQSVYALGDEKSIMLTSGSFNTPNNNAIEQVGVKPDYKLNKSADWNAAIDQAVVLLQKEI